MRFNLDALTFECIIGILDFERLKPQNVIIDAEIYYEYQNKFINYAEVADHIRTSMKQHQFTLIEEALISLHSSLKKDFSQILSLSLTITKPDILPDCRVSVTQKLNY